MAPLRMLIFHVAETRKPHQINHIMTQLLRPKLLLFAFLMTRNCEKETMLIADFPSHTLFSLWCCFRNNASVLLDVFQVPDACPPTDLQRFLPQLEPLQLEAGPGEGLLPEQLHFLHGRSYPGAGEHKRQD